MVQAGGLGELVAVGCFAYAGGACYDYVGGGAEDGGVDPGDSPGKKSAVRLVCFLRILRVASELACENCVGLTISGRG